MTGQALLQLVGSAAFATVFVAIINAIVNRRKLGAEAQNLSASATKAISDAAASTVKDVRDDNARLRTENIDLRTRVDALEKSVDEIEGDWRAERDQWKRVLQLHAAWDRIAIDRLAECGIEVPEPPPLTSPIRSRFAD